MLTFSVLAALALASLSTAHLVMKTPVPFNPETLNNSPLVDTAIGSSTSDFPCKQRPDVYKITTMNSMPVGQNQTLSFTGSASHGGGTCQLAVSLDKEPTASSVWKLIQVYEGGCPITGDGNDGTSTFPFSIPDKFPNGQATLAWTWYNRIGNREIYMNCAPIMVSGGSNDQDYYNSLPDMYVINLPSSQCSSVESTNQIIPNPGQFVIKGDPKDKAASATGPACAAAAAAQTNGVKGYQGSSAGNDTSSGSSGSAAASPAATTQTYNNGQYQQGQGAQAPATSAAVASGMTSLASTPVSLAVIAPSAVVVPTISALPSAAAATLPAVMSESAPSEPAPSAPAVMSAAPSAPAVMSGAPSTAPTQPAASSNGTSGGSSCSPDGAVVCNGANQFGLCNFGQVIWQDVAAGTTCVNGAISKKLIRKDSVHFRALE